MHGRGSVLVRELTDRVVHGSDAIDALRRFASEFGWGPSDKLDRYPGTEGFCNGHLIVEHGLDLTAVISFLRTDTPYVDLAMSERRALLELSYNNIIDWHLLPERSGMRVVFNRTDPPVDHFVPATSSDDVWRAETFDRLTGKRPNPNVRALDDALIDTVSFWKRAIASDLGTRVGVRHVSAIINAVVLVRALEDHQNRAQRTDRKLLLSVLEGLPLGEQNAHTVIRTAFGVLGQSHPPRWLNEIIEELDAFNGWDSTSLRDLLDNFYLSRFSPYKYDFHLISKHALSRVYEHYVSLLRDRTSPELSLFQELPEELRSKDLGSIYTPQYIARFFARFLREHRTPRAFRSLRTVDPACGSGMFLRSLLEMQCDPGADGFSVDSVHRAFAATYGIDIDKNACQATKLSLALLHLVLTGDFPATLNVDNGEAIDILSSRPDQRFDAVIANPPFVKWDGLSDAVRARLSAYMLEQGFGKQDLYLAFIKAAMEHLEIGGVLCFVLPHSFLLSKSASELRRQLSDAFAIRILADLSEVPVFEHTGVYVVLLIAERTVERDVPATIVKCREFVGTALQDALTGRMGAGDGYQVFPLDQREFRRERWSVLRSEEVALRDTIEMHPTLDQFFEVRQGLITGADSVFIRDAKACPRSERDVWRPLLTDREMLRFGVPTKPVTAVFMPFAQNGELLKESELRQQYPESWQYLKSHKSALARRSTVTRGARPWWEPAWPRSPAKLFVPKLVTPHLVLLPRFGVDVDGKYAVSRSPYLVPRSETGGPSLLKIICGVMNSAVGHWQLALTSHKYSRGYLMLEVRTLRDFHVPDPACLPAHLTRKLVRLVDALADAPERTSEMAELDVAVAEAFALSASQMELVGIVPNSRQ